MSSFLQNRKLADHYSTKYSRSRRRPALSLFKKKERVRIYDAEARLGGSARGDVRFGGEATRFFFPDVHTKENDVRRHNELWTCVHITPFHLLYLFFCC